MATTETAARWICENGTECDVLYEAGECSYDCDDGSAGSC